LLFVGECGAPFRRTGFGRVWRRVRVTVGLPEDFRFYDLRHTGHTLSTRSGATLKDTMVRAGPRADSRELHPWTLDETLDFLAASRKDPLYAAFVLAIAMGLRRGEIVGLRWSDLDLENPRSLRAPADAAPSWRVLYDDDPKSRRRRVVPLPGLCIARSASKCLQRL
jgi:integrase